MSRDIGPPLDGFRQLLCTHCDGLEEAAGSIRFYATYSRYDVIAKIGEDVATLRQRLAELEALVKEYA